MLSTLLLTPPFASDTAVALGPVVRTLATLVPATVEGLVRDVTVVATGADEGLRRVTEHAGCGLIEVPGFAEALTEALRAAKLPTLFLIRAGAVFDRGFLTEVATLLGPDHSPEDVQTLLLRQAPEGLAARILPDLAPVVGLIAPRERLRGSARDFAALVRRAGRARTLASRAHMVT